MFKSVMLFFQVMFLFSLSATAYAANGTVRITGIIPDYMPDQIRIKVDADIGTCTAGSWLDRFGRGVDENTKRENNKLTYSTLLAAMLAGTTVNLYLNDSNCQIDNIQVIN